MQKRPLFVILIFFFAAKISAQGNLVPNPGFDLHDTCPTLPGEIEKFSPWYDPTNASSDGFDFCGSNYAHAPDNTLGFQYPNNGNGYAGLIPFHGGNPNFREYIQVPLVKPLPAQRLFCLSFYVSPADSLKFTCDAIGMYISIQPVTSCQGCLINCIPQLTQASFSFITDTSSWTLISGSFTSSGNENFITIGNFLPDSLTHTAITNPTSIINSVFFYIDNVQILMMALPDAGNNALICQGDSAQIGPLAADSGVVYSWSPSTGLSDPSSSLPWAKPDSTTTYVLTISDPAGLYCLANTIDSVTITVNSCPIPLEYFVPTILKKNELFAISALPENTGLEVFDTRGRLIYSNENYQNDFRASNLAVGVYAYRLNFSDGSSQKGKICVVE